MNWRIKYFAITVSAIMVGCAPGEEPSGPTPFKQTSGKGSIESLYDVYGSLNDTIPDFSRVGYRWGDKEIPSYPVSTTISAPSDESDATDLIQNAINNAPEGTAVLLKAGTYRIAGRLSILKNGIVLRGEGESTKLIALGKDETTLISIGKSNNRTLSTTDRSAITGQHTATGQMFVTVEKPGLFSVGDRVVIFRPGTERWIHDIKMDNLTQVPGRDLYQWSAAETDMYWERIIYGFEGDKVFLDNPVVMPLDDLYGGGELIKCSMNRVSECGVEDMYLVSEYKKDDDTEHCRGGVAFLSSEHCWARGITAQHFVNCAISCAAGSRNITVSDCRSLSPKSPVKGGYRYAFYLRNGEMCLFRDCTADEDRHGFVSTAFTCGPNVYLNCTMTKAFDSAGPHLKWATGTLYDCLKTDGLLECQDRDWAGSGHGWAGANLVFWNCEAEFLTIQSPWVTAKNWAVGCTGTKVDGYAPERPDATWISYGKHVEPRSLYLQQLAARKEKGIMAAPQSYY